MSRHLRQMMTKLTSDKRMLCLVVSLFAVGMLFWGRLRLKELPKTAVADPEETTTGQISPDDTDRTPTLEQSEQSPFHQPQDGTADQPIRIDRQRFDDEKQVDVKLDKGDADN